MMELLVLGCTGIVVFLHGAHFFFHALTQHIALRSLSLSSSFIGAEISTLTVDHIGFWLWGLHPVDPSDDKGLKLNIETNCYNDPLWCYATQISIRVSFVLSASMGISYVHWSERGVLVETLTHKSKFDKIKVLVYE
ncbi:hypothetical protein E2542_SST00464 [Spatholobus suberectus]|nr:hypothetical protein E2542_SST00464 [Spatholobus suberectus]